MSFQSSPDAPKARDGFAEDAASHIDALYAVACRLTRNPTEAEDLVQDALVKAMRAKDQFQAGTNLKAWLFRILTNTFINKYRPADAQLPPDAKISYMDYDWRMNDPGLPNR
jgi:RNA polymerase sigma factor (sigma-70 family)